MIRMYIKYTNGQRVIKDFDTKQEGLDYVHLEGDHIEHYYFL